MMDNKYSKWIKTYIIDVLPAITIATYVLGIVYSTAFYYVFGIDITHFISLGEMFLDITNILLIIIAAYLIYIFYFYIIFKLGIHYFGKKFTLTIYPRFNRWVISKVLKRTSTGNVIIGKKQSLLTILRYVFYLFAALSLSLLISMALNEITHNFMGQGQEFMAVPFFLSLAALMISVPTIIHSIPSPKKLIYILVTAIMFYIFAIAVFAYCGNVNGRYVRDHDKATFEIKLKDGSILNNQSYRYINQVNNRVFLLDKKTNENMILANDGIMYMKIHMIPRNSK